MLRLGIDIGTSGVRTAVLENDTLLSSAKAAHPPQPQTHIDANLWWESVQTCLHTQMTTLREIGRDPQEITGIAVDGTSGSMVLVDRSLNPVSPVLMYNSKGFDAEAQLIADCADGDHITKGANSALARAMHLVGLADAQPAHLLHQADFITARLLGRSGVSDYNNALKTGFDPETGAWPSWVSEVINPSLLPEVVAPGTALGRLSPDISTAFGLSLGTVISAGTTDSIAAFLAAVPSIEEGIAVTSLGSTLAIKLMSKKRIDDPSIGLYSHRLGENWLVGGASNTGGAVLKHYFDGETLAKLSATIDPNQDSGLDYYPLLEPGERFPINDPKLQPRLTPRPQDDTVFLHGLLESIARIEADCYNTMVARGSRYPTAIFTAGGGAINETWNQIRARELGMSPKIAQQTEAAFGVATLIPMQ